MTDQDPLRTRFRPGGLRVQAHTATWESTVFMIAVGASVRYLEVPADQVASFLAAVDAGELDRELAGIAANPSGATLDKPGRVRAIAAFDRILRTAVARTERDTATGQLVDPGSQPRKRQRDDDQLSRGDSGSESSSQSAVAAASSPAGAGVGIAAVVSRSWWQSPVVAVGAVIVVVIAVAATVFAVTRPSGDPVAGSTAVVTTSEPGTAEPTSGPAEPTDSSAGGAAGGSAGATESVTAAGSPVPASTGAAAGSPTVASPTEPTASAAAAPGAPGDANRFSGVYSFTRTVTDTSGNESYTVGATEAGTLTLTAACDEPTCAIDGGGFGFPTISGNQLAFAGSGAQECPADPSITVTLLFTVTLNASATGAVNGVDKVTAMQGVGTLTAVVNGCPNNEIKPITYSYDVTRTG